jgi:uncharacterized repeat protein (TIGR04076 family)
MAEPLGTKVRVEIVEIMGGGTCPSGLEVGRMWEIGDGLCPQGMCAWAFNAILPFVATLRFNGRFPWRDEPTVRVCCPDADNPVVFRLTAES